MSDRFRHALNRYADWFTAEIPALPVQVAKIGLGVALFFHYLSYGDVLQFYFHELSPFRSFDPEGRIFAPWMVRSLYALILVFSVLFAVLWRYRGVGLPLLAGHILFVVLFPRGTFGWTVIVGPPLLYLTLARVRSGDIVSIWPLRLIQIQLAGFYFFAAANRVGNPVWVDGDQLFYFLHGSLTRFPSAHFAEWMPLLRFGTYFAWVLEFAAPALLAFRATRLGAVAMLIVMHVLIEAVGILGWWSHVMILFLVCTFVLPDLDFNWRKGSSVSGRAA